MGNGLIGKIFTWGTSANFSDTTTDVWLYGLLFIIVLSFLWSTVVRQVLRDV